MASMARLLFSSLITSLFLFGAQICSAQDYPSKPVRIIVGQTPGSFPDLVARTMGSEMSKSLGQPFVVEDKPGAGSLIAFEYVAKQVPADGYAIAIVTVASLASLPATVKDLRFDPLVDLPPFIGLAEARLVLGSSSKLPWKTFKELVASARANPGKFNYGTPNTAFRLMTEALIRELGLEVVHVPFPATGPYQQALVSSDIHMGFAAHLQAVSFGEKFRVLVVTGQNRLPALPDVPTFAELGYPKIKGSSYTLNVRAGTAKAVTEKLYASASRALQQPEVKAQFTKIGLELFNDTSPEAAVKALAEEASLYTETARKIGLQPQ